MSKVIHILILLTLSFSIVKAQETIVTGKIIDANSGDAIPFANVFFLGTQTGTITDFNGFYNLKINALVDSIVVSYIGYNRKSRHVLPGKQQIINFQLESNTTNLQEVIVYAGENPAYEIIRNVIKNKNLNDKRNLSAYQFKSYNKVEIDIDNMSEKFKKRKIVKKISLVIDSLEQIAGEDGKPILPIFIAESVSENFYRNNPKLKKEKILNTRMSGLFVEDGTLISQLIGSTFQEYNFYQNWLNIVEKDFVSPIADVWRLYYDYDLIDSLYIGGDFCYRIDIRPRRSGDLAFNGTMWITTQTYAIKQIDVSINKEANLNYIEKIKIQQELEVSKKGNWLPVKTRVLIDLAELANGSAGMLAKFYSSNKEILIDQPKEIKFYDPPIEVFVEPKNNNEEYWIKNRHDSLSPTELQVYAMIDTIKNIPVIKSRMELINILTYGFKNLGVVEVGHIFNTYAFNNVEGHRIRLGLKTSVDFSRKWIFKGHLAYGTLDQEFKYGIGGSYIFSRNPWISIGLERFKDLEQVGLNSEELANNYIFFAASKFGEQRRPYYNTINKFHFQSELIKGINEKIIIKNQMFDPLFDFQYFSSSEGFGEQVKDNYTTTEITLESRFSKGEVYLQNENERINITASKWPVLTFNYTLGIKGILGSDFEYHKFSFDMSQNLKMGFLGRFHYTLFGGKIFNPLPYPLLKIHIGNETPFYTTSAYSLMNNFEFVSDTYAGFKYQHYFDGFILNNIPLMKRLKWRLLTTGNILFGSVSNENYQLIPDINQHGEQIPKFNSLDIKKPYIELGYGVENIFKVLRIDAFHRLTYLNKPEVSKFGVKISFQIIL